VNVPKALLAAMLAAIVQSYPALAADTLKLRRRGAMSALTPLLEV
jgi:hypothetical protein